MSVSNALGAQDFFGKDDPDGVEKFKTVAFRVLYEQKVEDELKQMRQECDRLREDNTSLSKQLRDLQASFDANMDDRERVLAFKSKRIEELHLKVRDYEATNMSLLQTINGGHVGGDGTSAGTHAAMAALVNSGKPLFHALVTCKEQEYRRLYEDMRQQFEELTRQVETNAVVVREMAIFQQQKNDLEAQLKSLQQLNTIITADRDDKMAVLERKLVTEHDRLLKEKEAEIRVCQEAMETQMRRQLDVITLRTIEENQRVQLELRYLSAQLEKMVKHTDQLTAENKQTQHEKHIFEDMNASLSKKIKFYEQLFAKMQQQDHAKSQQCDSAFESDGMRPSGRFRLPRKPPLPSLYAAPPSCPPLRLPREVDEDERRDLDSSNQLNAIADALGEHLQKRDFTQKQVAAVIRYHRQHYLQQGNEVGVTPEEFRVPARADF